MSWGFYGRGQELHGLREILSRSRWFFARLTGRRRIGKTTLVQHALQATPTRPVFYVQIPDSAPAGVLAAVHDALNGHIERFLTAHRRYRGWRLERVAIAPKIDHAVRVSLGAQGAIPQDLTDLVQGL